MSNETSDPAENEDSERKTPDHLDGIEDGAGCTEIWEHLSRCRNERAK